MKKTRLYFPPETMEVPVRTENCICTSVELDPVSTEEWIVVDFTSIF